MNLALPTPSLATPNDPIVEAWNTVLFDKFARYEDILTHGLGQHGDALFDAVAPPVGGRLLDIGCGFGDTTVQLGARVGPGGHVIGIDCAENFVRASRQRADAAQAGNVSFVCADVQHAALPRDCDAIYARFGTMFFTSPVAALRNLRRSLRSGGFLAMSVWRRRVDNPCFHIAQRVVQRFLPPPDEATRAQHVTCGPGPFSMANADLVSDQLAAAGFDAPTFTRFDAPLCIGRTLEEAVAFARDLGPAGETLRLAGEAAESQRDAIDVALREAFTPLMHGDGVWATSSTWLITAHVRRNG